MKKMIGTVSVPKKKSQFFNIIFLSIGEISCRGRMELFSFTETAMSNPNGG